MSLLLGVIAGWTVTRAAVRWIATSRVLSPRYIVRGVWDMLRIRIGQIRAERRRTLVPWPIPTALPLANESAVALLALSFIAILPGLSVGQTMAWLGRPEHLLPLGLWVLARTSENLLPASGLYLGVSEQGQYKTYARIERRGAWLLASLLNATRLPVLRRTSASRGLSGGLIPRKLGGIPLDLIFRRRRIESLRTTEKAWSEVVTALLKTVSLVIVDGRSHGSILQGEFVRVIKVRPEAQLIVITRDDGTTVFDESLSAVGTSLEELEFEALTEAEAIMMTPDLVRRGRAREGRGRYDPHSVDALAEVILASQERMERLLRRLEQCTRADRALDVEVAEWAGTDNESEVPSYTESVQVALALVLERLERPSLNIDQRLNGNCEVELASETIADSWRVTRELRTSCRELAPAVLVCMFRALLARSDPYHRDFKTKQWRPLRPGLVDQSVLRGDDPRVTLLDRLGASLSTDTENLDAALREDLVRWMTMAFDPAGPPQTSLTGVETTLALFVGRLDVGLQISTGGGTRAVVSVPANNGWLRANSDDRPNAVYGNPEIAMLRAALKIDLGLYEMTNRHVVSETAAELVESCRSPFGSRP